MSPTVLPRFEKYDCRFLIDLYGLSKSPSRYLFAAHVTHFSKGIGLSDKERVAGQVMFFFALFGAFVFAHLLHLWLLTW